MVKRFAGSASAQHLPRAAVHMDQELTDLLRETQRLDQEISLLAEHIRLLKLTRLLLRL